MRRRKQSHVSIDDLIVGLYGTLDQDDSFEQPLRVVATALDSHMSGLHHEDFSTGSGELTMIGSLTRDEYLDYTDQYNRRWRGENLWMLRSLEGFKTQGFQHGEAVVTNDELMASPYYQHFLRHVDIHYGMGISIGDDQASSIAVASFHRDKAARRFEEQDFTLVRAIRPHLVNAFSLHQRLESAELSQQINLAPMGMFRIDADGCLLSCNPEAEALFAMHQLISVDLTGRVTFSSATARTSITKAAARCQATALPVSIKVGPDPRSGGSGLVLHLHKACRSVRNSRPASLIGFACSLDDRMHADATIEVVREVLGLTTAEARVAIAMHAFSDVEVAAPTLHISAATVRAHIKRIYQKLGISRQGQLTLRVERVLAGLPSRPGS